MRVGQTGRAADTGSKASTTTHLASKECEGVAAALGVA